MKKSVLIALVILSINVFSQTKSKKLITIKGITTSYGKLSTTETLNNVYINVYDYNNILSTHNCNEQGEFEFTIPTSTYITIEWGKEGYISRRILVDTQSNLNFKKIKPFDFEVTLLKREKGIDFSDLDFPMAIIKYSDEKSCFIITDRYTQHMLEKQEGILTKIAVKQNNILSDKIKN